MATKLHEADLANFFHAVTHFGAATTRTSDLMRWMQWEKQTSGFWTELQDRFQNALEEHEREEGWRLYTLQNEGHITLLCLDPEGREANEWWWTPVRKLSERPAPGRRKQTVVTEE